jgi:hypothetical protein
MSYYFFSFLLAFSILFILNILVQFFYLVVKDYFFKIIHLVLDYFKLIRNKFFIYFYILYAYARFCLIFSFLVKILNFLK